MTTKTRTETPAFIRGRYDAQRDRAPIFRSTRAYGIVAEIDDPLADEWDDTARADYLRGYDAGRDC
jgi:hypothetical protein